MKDNPLVGAQKSGPNPWDLVPKVTQQGTYVSHADSAPEFKWTDDIILFNTEMTCMESIKMAVGSFVANFFGGIAMSIFPPIGMLLSMIDVFIDFQQINLRFAKARLLGRQISFTCDLNTFVLFWFKEKMVNMATFGLYSKFFGSPRDQLLDSRLSWTDQALTVDQMATRATTQAEWVYFRAPGRKKGDQLAWFLIKTGVCCPFNMIGRVLGSKSWLRHLRIGGLGLRMNDQQTMCSWVSQAAPKICGLIGAKAMLDARLEAYDPASKETVTAAQLNSGTYKLTTTYLGWPKEICVEDGVVPNPAVYGADFDTFKSGETGGFALYAMKLTCPQSCAVGCFDGCIDMTIGIFAIGIPYAGVFIKSIYKPFIEYKKVAWFWEKCRIQGKEVKFVCSYKSFYTMWLKEAVLDNVSFGLYSAMFGDLRQGWMDAHLAWKADGTPEDVMDKRDVRQVLWKFYRAKNKDFPFMLEYVMSGFLCSCMPCCYCCVVPIASIPLRFGTDLWLKALRFDSLGVRIKQDTKLLDWMGAYAKGCLWCSKSKKMLWLDSNLELWNTRSVKIFNMHELVFGGGAPAPAPLVGEAKGSAATASSGASSPTHKV